MADPAAWQWFLPGPGSAAALGLTFVKDLTVAELEHVFGMDPWTGEMSSWAELETRQGDTFSEWNGPPFYLRTAQRGRWAIAFEYNQLLNLRQTTAGPVPDLPRGAISASLTWTLNTYSTLTVQLGPDGFSYYEVEARRGNGRLAKLAEQLGLSDEAVSDAAALAMLAEAVGIEPLDGAGASGPMRLTRSLH